LIRYVSRWASAIVPVTCSAIPGAHTSYREPFPLI
jgi:hypothetical protein